MTSGNFILIALLLAVVGSFSAAYAQDGAMRGTTDKGSLDILLEPTWSEGGHALFNVSFLNPGTDTLHQHQDYDVMILKDGNVIYSAARQINQPVIHNVEGTITVPREPYKFEQQGDYTVEVYLAGTGVGPTLIPTDESAKFAITVTPEFPAGLLGAVAAVVAAAVVASRRLRL